MQRSLGSHVPNRSITVSLNTCQLATSCCSRGTTPMRYAQVANLTHWFLFAFSLCEAQFSYNKKIPPFPFNRIVKESLLDHSARSTASIAYLCQLRPLQQQKTSLPTRTVMRWSISEQSPKCKRQMRRLHRTRRGPSQGERTLLASCKEPLICCQPTALAAKTDGKCIWGQMHVLHLLVLTNRRADSMSASQCTSVAVTRLRPFDRH